MLFPFLEPDYFTSIKLIHSMFYVGRIFSIMIALIVSIRKNQFLYVSVVVLVYYGVYLYSTIINNGNMQLVISHAILTIGFIMWLEILLKNNTVLGLQALNIIFSTLVYINIGFFLLFPDGYNLSGSSDKKYFLGVYNQFAATLIPAVITSVIYSLKKYQRILPSTKLLISVVFFTFIYFWSATSIIGISLIVTYLLFIHKKPLSRFVNTKTVIIGIAVLFFMVVYTNNLNYFTFLIEDILGKDLTLSTRTQIWERALILINDSPLYGYGAIETGSYIVFSSTSTFSAHNTVLQILLQVGFVGFSVFLLLIGIMLRNIKRYQRHHLGRFILFSFFTSCTMMLTEVYSFRFIYLILLLGVYVGRIITEYDSFVPKRKYKEYFKTKSVKHVP